MINTTGPRRIEAAVPRPQRFLKLISGMSWVPLSRWINSGFMRILVVDDDRAVRESLRRSLEFNGYTVQLAEDGQQAMHAVTQAARLRTLLRRSTFDRPGNPGAALIVADNDPSVHETDSGSSPIGASARGAMRVTSGRPVCHAGLKARLTTKIIGVASVIVATIGLIPPFVGAFGCPMCQIPRLTKIGNMIISFVNGMPEVVDRVRVGVEVRAIGQKYTYWLTLMLILTDGSVRTERR